MKTKDAQWETMMQAEDLGGRGEARIQDPEMSSREQQASPAVEDPTSEQTTSLVKEKTAQERIAETRAKLAPVKRKWRLEREAQEAKFREEELERFDRDGRFALVAHIVEWVSTAIPAFRLKPTPKSEEQAVSGYHQAFEEDEALSDLVFASEAEAFGAGFVFGQVMGRYGIRSWASEEGYEAGGSVEGGAK